MLHTLKLLLETHACARLDKPQTGEMVVFPGGAEENVWCSLVESGTDPPFCVEPVALGVGVQGQDGPHFLSSCGGGGEEGHGRQEGPQEEGFSLSSDDDSSACFSLKENREHVIGS